VDSVEEFSRCHSLYDPLAIIALVVSLTSAIFIVLKEGIGLLLGFRESAQTSRTRREIDVKLRNEVKNHEREVMKSITLEKDQEKELQTLVDLGQSAYYARSITTRLLEQMTQRMGSVFLFFR
jgi:predicted membrane chloride channel (bestrophin family)